MFYWDLYRDYRYLQFMMEERHRLLIFFLVVVVQVVLLRLDLASINIIMIFWLGFWVGSAVTHSFGKDKTFLSSVFHFGNKESED
jgi:hypothetical protein